MSGSKYTGSDLVASRSAVFVSNLVRQLGTLGQLESAFGTSTANITACAATVAVVLTTLFGSEAMTIMPGAGTETFKLQAAMGKLNEANLVYFGLKPDHHFITFPVDDTRMGIIQGFQGCYNLADWIDWRGIGMLTKAEFQTAMTGLLGTSASARKAGALKLFSFELSAKAPSTSKLVKSVVASEIELYFNRQVKFSAIGYRGLT